MKAFIATAWLPFAFLVMSIGYLGSVAYIPVSLAAIIFYLFPFYVAVLSSLLGRDPLTPGKGVALVAAFVGLALALGPGFDDLDWRGIAGALAAAAAFGTVIVFSGPIMRDQDIVAINWFTNLWMAILLGGYLALAGGLAWPDTDLGALGLAGGTIFYIIGFSAWLLGLTMVAPIRAAILLNLEPLVSIGAAWLLLGERLSAAQGIGVALVIAAVMAVAVLGARTKTEESA
jgi:drug/metabolite transporter (DMT)-like permease